MLQRKVAVCFLVMSTQSVMSIIGVDAWDLLISSVSKGEISSQQMRDIAWSFPTRHKRNKVGVEHEKRMENKASSLDETEMRNILSDWFKCGDMPGDSSEALDVLISLFTENGNKPLAMKLRRIRDNLTQVVFVQKSFQKRTTTFVLGSSLFLLPSRRLCR